MNYELRITNFEVYFLTSFMNAKTRKHGKQKQLVVVVFMDPKKQGKTTTTVSGLLL
jgi:hypothetical protein